MPSARPWHSDWQGGIGFLYGLFSYAEGPTMTIVARSQSMPDPFLEPLFEATGTEVVIETTGGAVTAAKRLDRHLESRTPMLCTVASGLLPYLGAAADEAATAPHVVGVVGADSGQLLLDDRSPRPIAIDRDTFAAAHAATERPGIAPSP